MGSKILAWIRASWKAIMPLIVVGLWELAIQVIDTLQGTWVDQVWVVTVLTAVAVWLKSNKPVPIATPE